MRKRFIVIGNMSDVVLSNADLARKLVGMGASEILASRKSIRDAEPCADIYETFRETGWGD